MTEDNRLSMSILQLKFKEEDYAIKLRMSICISMYNCTQLSL